MRHTSVPSPASRAMSIRWREGRKEGGGRGVKREAGSGVLELLSLAHRHAARGPESRLEDVDTDTDKACTPRPASSAVPDRRPIERAERANRRSREGGRRGNTRQRRGVRRRVAANVPPIGFLNIASTYCQSIRERLRSSSLLSRRVRILVCIAHGMACGMRTGNCELLTPDARHIVI